MGLGVKRERLRLVACEGEYARIRYIIYIQVVTKGESTVMSCPSDVTTCNSRYPLRASANPDTDYVGAVV